LARKAIYKHLTQVNTSSHPDDGTSPVGSNEWNEAPDPAGMLGFTAQTIASATSVTPTNSVVLLSGSTNVSTIAVAETAEYDLLYIITTGSVTLVNTSSPSSSGDIRLLADENKDLSTTVPTILMRKGTYWYEYGGGAGGAATEVTAADESSDTTCFPLFVTAATGDLAPKTGSNLAFNSNTGVLTATGFAGALTGNVTGDASGSSGSCTGNSATTTALATARTIGGTSFDGTGNIAITTNANLTGDVTSSGNATTIATDAVDIAMLSATGTASSSTFLRGDNAWTAVGGNHTEQGWDVYTTHTGTATTADSIAQMFARRIDANNDGLYIMLWKNGASTEVQIA